MGPKVAGSSARGRRIVAKGAKAEGGEAERVGAEGGRDGLAIGWASDGAWGSVEGKERGGEGGKMKGCTKDKPGGAKMGKNKGLWWWFPITVAIG